MALFFYNSFLKSLNDIISKLWITSIILNILIAYYTIANLYTVAFTIASHIIPVFDNDEDYDNRYLED
jgi:hypothetical protein